MMRRLVPRRGRSCVVTKREAQDGYNYKQQYFLYYVPLSETSIECFHGRLQDIEGLVMSIESTLSPSVESLEEKKRSEDNSA